MVGGGGVGREVAVLNKWSKKVACWRQPQRPVWRVSSEDLTGEVTAGHVEASEDS